MKVKFIVIMSVVHFLPLKEKFSAIQSKQPSALENRFYPLRGIHPELYALSDKPDHPLRELIDNYVMKILSNHGTISRENVNPIYGHGFFVKSKGSEKEQNLSEMIKQFRHAVTEAEEGDKRMSFDIWGNANIHNPRLSYARNKQDPLAFSKTAPAAYAFETDEASNLYRQMVQKTLETPDKLVETLSTDKYGVYEAHDHSLTRPHLLIIPFDKKFKDFTELAQKGSDADIKDYYEVMKKVAQSAPRRQLLEHELFFSDTGTLQKAPFLYMEYIPRRNEYLPNELDPHPALHKIYEGAQERKQNENYLVNQKN